MDELTDAAKAEIREAIRIVREDRFEKYVRERAVKPPEPPANPPTKAPEGPTPPPAKDPAGPAGPAGTGVPEGLPSAGPEPEVERSRYWGEILR